MKMVNFVKLMKNFNNFVFLVAGLHELSAEKYNGLEHWKYHTGLYRRDIEHGSNAHQWIQLWFVLLELSELSSLVQFKGRLRGNLELLGSL